MWILISSLAFGAAHTDYDDATAAVSAYLNAADAGDTKKLERAMHTEFRVIAQMPDGVSVMSRELYLKLVGGGKIGGIPRAQDFDAVMVSGDLATVKGTLESDAARFDSTWTVVRTDDGWRVAQDATVFQPKGK